MLKINELISTLHQEFLRNLTQLGLRVPREVDFPKVEGKIKVAIGMRRSGKTSLMQHKIHSLITQGVSPKQILYINFEDERLPHLDAQSLGELLDAFYTLYPENHHLLCYLFLDEIQNTEDWPRTIRRIFDSKKVQIYLTGSSAKLLSKEIATSLRGRSIAIEVFPFSFNEFLLSQQFTPSSAVMSRETWDQKYQYLLKFLDHGGFPEVITLETPDRVRILQDYVDVVIFRDIVERYGITNIVLIKYLIKILLNYSGRGFSVTKFYNDLKSQGFSAGRATVYEYLSYLEDAYLIFTVPLYSESVRKSQTNLKKIYTVDTGLIQACTLSFSKNWGRLFENLIYLDLRRRGDEIYYYLTTDGRYEIDFFTRSLDGTLHLYQVCWDDTDEVYQREMRALTIAEKELKVQGKLVTLKSYLQEGLV